MQRSFPLFFFGMLFGISVVSAQEPIVIADFEGSNYGDWKVTGDAFGKGPASGTLPGQMQVEGFNKKFLVNSFHGGDDAVGRLASSLFKIERRFATFLIGGGGWADETCMNLIVDGKIVRTAVGPNMESGGSERLNAAAWDLSDLQGKNASIEIVDQRRGGWGHINVDYIVLTSEKGDTPLAVQPKPLMKDASKEITLAQPWLHFPVKNHSKQRNVKLFVDGKEIRSFDIGLADDKPDWFAPTDLSRWVGKKVKIVVNALPQDSKGLNQVAEGSSWKDAEAIYQEPLRSQLHFSPKRGWTNDPNGLVFYRGEYHLFFQHNPYGWDWGNMHWGHATSRDLVHWEEHGEALYPDEFGPMFSGSAVVDWKNTSGFGKNGEPPLVLIYTAAGNPTTQCIAYSNDGRHFTKYEKNPVIPQVTGGNRDPKVMWHEPTKQWVLVVYVETSGKQHTVHFYTSSNLRDWKLASITKGGIDGDKYLFECPDFFELAVDNSEKTKKWVLNSANSEYAIGTFDGTNFKPESSRLPDVRGIGFYAAQTFSDLPDGRRVQIGWLQAPSPGMSFNQLQSLPCELSLRTTDQGVQLFRTPVKELQSLRLGGDRSNALSDVKGEFIELKAEWDIAKTPEVEFKVRGARIAYDAKSQELTVNQYQVKAPAVKGKQNLHVYVDRTVLEVLSSDGLIYVPLPWIAKSEERSINVPSKEQFNSLEVYELQSIWKASQ